MTGINHFDFSCYCRQSQDSHLPFTSKGARPRPACPAPWPHPPAAKPMSRLPCSFERGPGQEESLEPRGQALKGRGSWTVKQDYLGLQVLPSPGIHGPSINCGRYRRSRSSLILAAAERRCERFSQATPHLGLLASPLTSAPQERGRDSCKWPEASNEGKRAPDRAQEGPKQGRPA